MPVVLQTHIPTTGEWSYNHNYYREVNILTVCKFRLFFDKIRGNSSQVKQTHCAALWRIDFQGQLFVHRVAKY